MEGHGRELERHARPSASARPATSTTAVVGPTPVRAWPASRVAMVGRCAEPSTPDSRLMPKSIMPAVPAPNTAYFKAASLLRRPVPLSMPAKRVGGHAGHLDAQQHDQHVIGRNHQAHAQRAPEHEHVEFGRHRRGRARRRSGSSRRTGSGTAATSPQVDRKAVGDQQCR